MIFLRNICTCALLKDDCRYACDYGTRWHLSDHYSIRTDYGMIANGDRPKNFGASTDIDVTTDFGAPRLTGNTNSYLLKDEAVRSNDSTRIDDYAIWMRNHEAASNLSAQVYLRLRDDGPKMVLNHPPFTGNSGKKCLLSPSCLVHSYASDKAAGGVPKHTRLFP